MTQNLARTGVLANKRKRNKEEAAAGREASFMRPPPRPATDRDTNAKIPGTGSIRQAAKEVPAISDDTKEWLRGQMEQASFGRPEDLDEHGYQKGDSVVKRLERRAAAGAQIFWENSLVPITWDGLVWDLRWAHTVELEDHPNQTPEWAKAQGGTSRYWCLACKMVFPVIHTVSSHCQSGNHWKMRQKFAHRLAGSPPGSATDWGAEEKIPGAVANRKAAKVVPEISDETKEWLRGQMEEASFGCLDDLVEHGYQKGDNVVKRLEQRAAAGFPIFWENSSVPISWFGLVWDLRWAHTVELEGHPNQAPEWAMARNGPSRYWCLACKLVFPVIHGVRSHCQSENHWNMRQKYARRLAGAVPSP